MIVSLSIILLLLYKVIDQAYTIEYNKDANINTIDEPQQLRDSLIKSTTPADYVSDDISTQITYYPNGNLKQVSVFTKVYFEPNEDTTSGFLGEHVYVTQLMEFYPDKTLKKVQISGEEGKGYFYYKGEDGEIEVLCRESE